jgi:hypothetical protein
MVCVCCQQRGACCAGINGICALRTKAECDALSGWFFLGEGTSCSPYPCGCKNQSGVDCSFPADAPENVYLTLQWLGSTAVTVSQLNGTYTLVRRDGSTNPISGLREAYALEEVVVGTTPPCLTIIGSSSSGLVCSEGEPAVFQNKLRGALTPASGLGLFSYGLLYDSRIQCGCYSATCTLNFGEFGIPGGNFICWLCGYGPADVTAFCGSLRGTLSRNPLP